MEATAAQAVAALFGFGGLIAFSVKLLDIVRYVSGKNWNGVVSQLAAWASGIVAVVLFGESNIAAGFINFGEGIGTLADFDFASKAILGIGLVSIGSLIVDQRPKTVPPLVPAKDVNSPSA
jgi:hypothetical protein